VQIPQVDVEAVDAEGKAIRGQGASKSAVKLAYDALKKVATVLKHAPECVDRLQSTVLVLSCLFSRCAIN
jgi:hypothetical protein